MKGGRTRRHEGCKRPLPTPPHTLSFAFFYGLVPYKPPNVTAVVNPSTAGLMSLWYIHTHTLMGVCDRERRKKTRRMGRVERV